MDDQRTTLQIVTEIRDAQLRLLRAVERWGALRAYVRHLDGCAQTPCSCGLDALLALEP